jgi:hypothetical protein
MASKRFTNHVLFVLADGARVDVLRELLDQGELPHIQSLIARGSLRDGVTCFPSVTGPAYLPYLTGMFPGTANIPGIRWFDRENFSPWWKPSLFKFRSYVGLANMLVRFDLTKKAKTLFEHDAKNINVLNFFVRGCSWKNFKMRFTRIWHLFWAHRSGRWDKLDQMSFREVKKVYGEAPSMPPFLFWAFASIDEFSHLYGVRSAQTLAAYKQLDANVGDLLETINTRFPGERVDWVIAADHGLTDTHTHLELVQLMKEEGYKPLAHPLIFPRPLSSAIMVSGNAMAHIYVRSTVRGWKIRTSHEYLLEHHKRLIDRLLTEEAVDFVVMRAANSRKHILGRDGHTWFRVLPTGLVEYTVVSGKDPLGLNIESRKHHLDRVLELSLGTQYPDSIAQIEQIFRSPRTGDILVTARKGFDLRDRFEFPEHHASHGSLHAEHMFIPVISTLPLSAGAVRSADLYPTICQALGYAIPESIDGRTKLLDASLSPPPEPVVQSVSI